MTYTPAPIQGPPPSSPLAAEVRQVRETVSDVTASVRGLVDEVSILRAENAYLRERLAQA